MAVHSSTTISLQLFSAGCPAAPSALLLTSCHSSFGSHFSRWLMASFVLKVAPPSLLNNVPKDGSAPRLISPKYLCVSYKARRYHIHILFNSYCYSSWPFVHVVNRAEDQIQIPLAAHKYKKGDMTSGGGGWWPIIAVLSNNRRDDRTFQTSRFTIESHLSPIRTTRRYNGARLRIKCPSFRTFYIIDRPVNFFPFFILNRSTLDVWPTLHTERKIIIFLGGVSNHLIRERLKFPRWREFFFPTLEFQRIHTHTPRAWIWMGERVIWREKMNKKGYICCEPAPAECQRPPYCCSSSPWNSKCWS